MSSKPWGLAIVSDDHIISIPTYLSHILKRNDDNNDRNKVLAILYKLARTKGRMHMIFSPEEDSNLGHLQNPLFAGDEKISVVIRTVWWKKKRKKNRILHFLPRTVDESLFPLTTGICNLFYWRLSFTTLIYPEVPLRGRRSWFDLACRLVSVAEYFLMASLFPLQWLCGWILDSLDWGNEWLKMKSILLQSPHID